MGGERGMHCFTGALCYYYYVSTVGAERCKSEEIVSTSTKRQYSILEKKLFKKSALVSGRIVSRQEGQQCDAAIVNTAAAQTGMLLR